MPVLLPAFLAEPSAAAAPTSARADRSAETMQRLRHPFQTHEDRESHDATPGASR